MSIKCSWIHTIKTNDALLKEVNHPSKTQYKCNANHVNCHKLVNRNGVRVKIVIEFVLEQKYHKNVTLVFAPHELVGFYVPLRYNKQPKPKIYRHIKGAVIKYAPRGLDGIWRVMKFWRQYLLGHEINGVS